MASITGRCVSTPFYPLDTRDRKKISIPTALLPLAHIITALSLRVSIDRLKPRSPFASSRKRPFCCISSKEESERGKNQQTAYIAAILAQQQQKTEVTKFLLQKRKGSSLDNPEGRNTHVEGCVTVSPSARCLTQAETRAKKADGPCLPFLLPVAAALVSKRQSMCSRNSQVFE